MTWWTDFLTWNPFQVISSTISDWMLANLFGGVAPTGPLEILAAAVWTIVQLLLVLLPYTGIVITLYFLTAVSDAAGTGNLKPLADIFFVMYGIIVQIAQAVAEAIPL